MTTSDPAFPSGPTSARPPRAAATLLVVRDSPAGVEVLLSRRAERGDHNSGAWVFPGGVVDGGDRHAHRCCAGLDDVEASRRLGLPEGGLDFHVAAIRECFEESGLLFAEGRDGTLVTLDDDAERVLDAWREPLHRGERTIDELCAAHGLRLAVDRLVYLSHWLTPIGRPKRFDTRFFVAMAPPAQTAAHDGREMVGQQWIRAAEALRLSATLKLMTPTQKTLESIANFDRVEALMAWAAGRREVTLTMPRIGSGRDGMRPVMPEEPAFAELGRIDPAGHGHGWYDIVADRPVVLSSRVVRVTANNGNVMTGPGTNSYLVGGGPRNEWAVIDPGPLDEAHVQAIVAAAPGPIRWIFATHTHHDHSPATVALKALTGAVVHGRVAAHREWQDASFEPDIAVAGGERFALSTETTLRAIHTPGHASNHLCYLLEEEKTLFTGDHVMQASTVVINPPDGDMAAYVASLRELLQIVDAEIDWLAPGHGFLMAEPRGAIEAIVRHRLKREAKVVTVLREHRAARIDALLPVVYDDVPARLHPMALRSLTAHLLKLKVDGAATDEDGRWSLLEQ